MSCTKMLRYIYQTQDIYFLFFNELHCYILVSSAPSKTLEEIEK